jgi:leader peptidase (prepilin peptidase)/N-methyltransferase
MPSQLQTIVTVYVFAFGAVVGSFLNVLIYRIPRHRSIVWPGSACPSCGTRIRWHDNIPLLSWMILLGRCRSCRAPISLRYPLVEASAAVMAVLAWRHYGVSMVTVEVAVFAWISLVLGLIDLEHQLLHDVLTLPAAVFGVVASACGGLTTLVDSLLGAGIGAALLTSVILLYRLVRREEGMGWGDVKYLAAIGAVVGAYGCLWVLIAASMAGAAVGLGLIACGRGSGKTALPFGSFLAIAVIVYLYLPEPWRSLSFV